MYTIYRATQNADLTEGRGQMITVGLFSKLEDAVKAVQGRGVMGHGTGDVYAVKVFETYAEFTHELERIKKHDKVAFYDRTIETLVYGYRKDWKGQWGYGFVDNRDAPIEDRDYLAFMSAKRKLEEATENLKKRFGKVNF